MRIRLEQFEGPLDLLLAMIEEEKLDISAISLAKVAGEFMGYVNAHNFLRLEELIYFLEIGARLVVLKTRLLLPYLSADDEEEDLVECLQEYRKYKIASQMLHSMWMDKERTLYSARVGADLEKTFGKRRELQIARITPSELRKAMKRVALTLQNAALPHIAISRRIFNLHERIASITQFLAKTERIMFSELIESAYKNEIIANFIALLELEKSRVVLISQRKLWGEIVIEKSYAAENPN